MDTLNLIKEIILNISVIFFCIIAMVFIGMIIILLIIQDSLIFIYKKTGEILWQTKQ